MTSFINKWNIPLGRSTDGSTSDNKAFIARKGETIDATIESHIYQVRLKDSLFSSLKFGKTKDAEVAWIDAKLTYQVNIARKKHTKRLILKCINWHFSFFF